MPDFREQFKTHLSGFRSAPFLFVGSGLSRRYLELSDWPGLLRQMAKLTGQTYDYYLASADGHLPAVASLIAADLHESWWHDDAFAQSRQQFDGLLHTSESALKAEVCRCIAAGMERIPQKGPLAAELALLRNAVIDGVITTNFDPLQETIFPDLRVFVGQEELLFEASQGVGELYKIHGSTDQPDSLVLTQRDFEDFHDRNPYLAAKLMTIFVEHPVIFIGYSLSDENIGDILRALVSCLRTEERIQRLGDRLIFVRYDASAPEATMAPSVIPVDGNQIPVLAITVPDFVDIFTVLGSVERTFPARLLRQLKEHVYELVLERHPPAQLYVLPLDPGQDPRDVDVVFGVGAIKEFTSYAGLTVDDLVTDVLSNGDTYDALRVVKQALPAILTHRGNVPVYKYLREARLLDADGNLLDPDSVDSKVCKHVESRADRLGVLNSQRGWVRKAVEAHPRLAELIREYEAHEVLKAIPGLDLEHIPLKRMQHFLADETDSSYGSQWRKMVCLYDWLRYGRAPKPRRQSVRRRPAATKR